MMLKTIGVYWCAFVLVIGALITGCINLGETTVPGQSSSLRISVKIPSVLQTQEVSSQSILEEITLQDMVFSVTNGFTGQIMTIPIEPGDHQVQQTFTGLKAGEWTVEVLALDTDGYEVGFGTKDVLVGAGEIAEEDVTVEVLPGELTVQVQLPDTEYVASGQVVLMGLVDTIDDIQETFAAEANGTVTLNIGEVPARVWLLKADLFNADGQPMVSGQAQIPVLPGRITLAEIEFSHEGFGGLTLITHWNLPPEQPPNVTAEFDEGVVSVHWDEVVGVEGYMVIRSVTPTGHGDVLSHTLISDTHVIDPGPFVAGTSYYYRVVAYDNQGLSSFFSDVASITVPLPGDVGEQRTYTAGTVEFHMRLAPAAEFPTRVDDSGQSAVHQPFWIAETLVTYELWHTVKQWALDNGYSFAHLGSAGSNGDPGDLSRKPVTTISWRDSIVWTNALSEMLDYEPVYIYDDHIIRDATDSTACDNAVLVDGNGFRLPTSSESETSEWELAARYQGLEGLPDAVFFAGLYWTPGNYASGASDSIANEAATQAVAWFHGNSGGSAQDVGLKQPNALGLYDMSGNVREWTSTITLDQPPFVSALVRGGSWNSDLGTLYISMLQGFHMSHVADTIGFRIVRTHR